MEFRYSQLLTMMYVTLMYGSGIPILYLFMVISYFLTYLVDKFMLLRIYSKPPRFNKKLMTVTRNWMVGALFLHFLFGFWIYSNS